MFSLNQSQNTLKQVKVTVTLPESNKNYNGNPRSEIITVTPADAVYSIKDSQGNKIKTSKGNATLTGTELNMGVNNGANASYSIHPLGDENYTYVLDNQQFVTGTLSIGPSTITIASSGSTSFVYNGSTRTIGYTVSGVSNADTNYDVSVKSATNAGSYTAALSESSANYTLGSPSSFSWTITPSTITLSSSGSTSFVYNGSTRTVGYVVSGVHAADPYYTVSGISSTNAGSYTATLSENSPNYTLGSPSTFSWGITKLAITSVTWSIGSATTSAHNSTAQSVTVSSIAPTGATYSLATTTATNVGSVAKTILTGTGNYSGSFTSPNLTIGAPPAPANFTASVSGTTVNLSWSVVPGCKYFVYRGAGILVAEVHQYSLSTSFAAVADANYTFYVIAQTLNVPTNSGESRTAIVYTGKAAWYTYPAYTGTYANQSPLCNTGSKDGTIGLKNYPQGSYGGFVVNIVRVKSAKTNSKFVTGSLTSSTRTLKWNLNGTSASWTATANPSYTGINAATGDYNQITKNVTTTGTVTYTMVAGGTGWSTNNTSGVSGIYWMQAEWRWDGWTTQQNAAIPSTVSYT